MQALIFPPFENINIVVLRPSARLMSATSIVGYVSLDFFFKKTDFIEVVKHRKTIRGLFMSINRLKLKRL